MQLWKLFRHYSPPPAGKDAVESMGLDDVVRFVKDCRLPPRLVASKSFQPLLTRVADAVGESLTTAKVAMGDRAISMRPRIFYQ